MINPSHFMRIKNDVNGNPRMVCHFTHLDVHGPDSGIEVLQRYAMALALAKTLGGRKFHNKQYGGGIVFQEYPGCLDALCHKINTLVGASNAQ